MLILKWLTPIFTGGAFIVLAACAPASEPLVQPTATLAGDPTQLPSVSTAVGTPVPRSAVRTVFAKPLSSGLSVADVTENALPSVGRIVAGSRAGTGFIIDYSGLVVTNRHIVEGRDRVTVWLATEVHGIVEKYQGIVIWRHPSLDLAYVEIDANRRFTPVPIGDSDELRVGEDVIAIGFPLGGSLGMEPTVSVGIISAIRSGRLQTDASLNPGNSGGPLLNMFGQVVGVVVSRVETNETGRPVAGIGFAIPIDIVRSELVGRASRAGGALPTPTLTPFPTIAPLPDVEATKAALDTMDAHRRQVELATRTAIEARQEALRHAASLEATRVAELPTPTPEPTPTPLPTPTPHPRTFCQEWEALVLEWIKQGNNYHRDPFGYRYNISSGVPDHPQLSAPTADQLCLTEFPFGVLTEGRSITIGDGRNQLLPGLYEYRREGDKRVPLDSFERPCKLVLNQFENGEQSVEMPFGEPFTFQFYGYHNRVSVDCRPYNEDTLYRIGD